jgi:hypothetical protein
MNSEAGTLKHPMARSALCQLRESLALFAVLIFRGNRTDPKGATCPVSRHTPYLHFFFSAVTSPNDPVIIVLLGLFYFWQPALSPSSFLGL